MKPISRFTIALMGLLVQLSVADAPKADDKIQVERTEATVEVKKFDPARPPNPGPQLEPGEAAVCVYRFEVEGDIRYSYRERPVAKGAKPGGPAMKSWEATVDSMSMKLALKVTIWLPVGAGERLTAHEHGHRQIAESYYAKADVIARGLAGKIVGQKFVAAGADAEAVIGKQISAMNSNVTSGYLSAINGPCDKAQKLFDEMTRHGTKASPTTDEAVKKVLEAGK